RTQRNGAVLDRARDKLHSTESLVIGTDVKRAAIDHKSARRIKRPRGVRKSKRAAADGARARVAVCSAKGQRARTLLREIATGTIDRAVKRRAHRTVHRERAGSSVHHT